MKLSGNNKSGRYVPSAVRSRTQSPSRVGNEMNENRRAAAKRKRSIRALRILLAVLAVIWVVLVIIYIVLKLGITPPEVNLVPKPGKLSAQAEDASNPAPAPSRDRTKFTFAILGMDDGNGNADTIMVATFDDKNYTLNVVNIPRDTLVNVSWPTKKINTFYANGGMDSVVEGLTDLLGYQVDFYVKVDLDAFSKLINGIGGVYFDVPKDMYYHDPAQSLLIDLKAGPQLLDGDKALQLVRARKNVWATGDIGRVETQQAFLKAAAEQILEKKSSIKVPALIDIFLNDVDTDITALKLGWFAKEFFKMDAANISFETIPANYYDTVSGISYCTIKVSDWLNVINAKLYPFDGTVKAEDVSILTRDENGNLYVTNGVWAGKKSWGSGGSSGSSVRSPSPSEKPSASPSPNSSPSPSPSDTPPPSPSEEVPSPSPSGEDTSPSRSPSDIEGEVSPTTSASPSDSPSPSPSG